MKRSLLIILCAILALPVKAQVIEGVISVSARDNVLNKLPKEIAYVLPDFAEATLNYTDGRFSVGRLNICLLDNSVRYIDDKSGDTLFLSNQASVKELIHNDTTYRCIKNSIMKELAAENDKQLAQRFRLKLTEVKEDAGYSSLPATSTAVTSNVSRFDPSRNFDVEKEMSYKHERDFVLVDGDKVYPARQSSFSKVFPAAKKAIRGYIRDNNLDLNKESDLIRLFELCSETQN